MATRRDPSESSSGEPVAAPAQRFQNKSGFQVMKPSALPPTPPVTAHVPPARMPPTRPPPTAPQTDALAPLELPLDALTPLEDGRAAPARLPLPMPAAPRVRPSDLDPIVTPARPRPRMGSLDPPMAPAHESAARHSLESLDPVVAPKAPGTPGAKDYAPTFIPQWDTTPKEIEPPSKLPFYVTVAAAVVVALSGAGIGLAALLAPPPEALSLADERAVGDAWMAKGAEAHGGLRTDAIVAHVGRVVTAVGTAMREPLKGRSARAAVVKDVKDATLFALPDGTVVITTALLARLTSDAELAVLSAHALSHIALGHAASRLSGSEHIVRDALAAGTPVVSLAAVMPTVQAPFDAASEAGIDALTMRALRDAGFDPQAVHAVYGRLQSGSPTSSWPAHHAVDAARVAALKSEPQSGRSGAAEYQKRILDVLSPPPLPPKKPARPKTAADADEEAADAADAVAAAAKAEAKAAAEAAVSTDAAAPALKEELTIEVEKPKPRSKKKKRGR